MRIDGLPWASLPGFRADAMRRPEEPDSPSAAADEPASIIPLTVEAPEPAFGSVLAALVVRGARPEPDADAPDPRDLHRLSGLIDHIYSDLQRLGALEQDAPREPVDVEV